GWVWGGGHFNSIVSRLKPYLAQYSCFRKVKSNYGQIAGNKQQKRSPEQTREKEKRKGKEKDQQERE
ncbi:MAG: hypothetical protein V2A67_11875, partial [Bacteroidota bacterium]